MSYSILTNIVALVRVRRTAAPGFRQVAWVGAAILSNFEIQSSALASCSAATIS